MSNTLNTICDTVIKMGIASAIGYGVCAAFNVVNPIHGAVFCATSLLVSKMVDPVFKEIFNTPTSSKACTFVGNVISLLVGVALSAGISTLLGFPITFTAGLILTAASIFTFALALLTATAFIGCVAQTRHNCHILY